MSKGATAMAEPTTDEPTRSKRKMEVVASAAKPLSEGDALAAMIERLVLNPASDLDKLQRVIDMRERFENRKNELEFDAAMAAAQTEMGPVNKDASNQQTRSKYASYLALDRAVRPLYTKHGFALSFNTPPGAPENWQRVTCDVSHRGGHKRHYQIDMPADGKGAKGGDVMTITHATMSAITYGMRALLKMIFNIAVGEWDDDGNGAGGAAPEKISERQAKIIQTAIVDGNRNLEKFMRFFKIEAIRDLTLSQYKKAVVLLSIPEDER